MVPALSASPRLSKNWKPLNQARSAMNGPQNGKPPEGGGRDRRMRQEQPYSRLNSQVAELMTAGPTERPALLARALRHVRNADRVELRRIMDDVVGPVAREAARRNADVPPEWLEITRAVNQRWEQFIFGTERSVDRLPNERGRGG